MLKFEKKSDTVSVAFFDRNRVNYYTGKPFKALTAVRAIRERDGWRIDQCGAVAGAWMPWEPINETRYLTQDDAEKAIKEWVKKEGA